MVKFAYSPVQHLANALFVNHDPGHVMMAFVAYFDTSQSHGQAKNVITMAGFVSTEKKWVAFEHAWTEVLNKYEVPFLHMKEFAHSVGAFKGWKGDEERRTQFLISLIKVAKKYILKGAVFSVGMEDFEEVNKDFLLRENWGGEYAFAGMGAVTPIMEWKQKRFPKDNIRYVFEDGDYGQHHLRQCLKQEHLSYSFIPKIDDQHVEIKYIVPFQIADFASWENRAAFDRINRAPYDAPVDDPLKNLRKSFQALVKQLPCGWKLITKEYLAGLCNAKNLRRTDSSYLVPDADNHPSSQA